jgi:hypothetical protein
LLGTVLSWRTLSSKKAAMKVYLRQAQLAKRWSMSVRGIQRARQERKIPQPDFYLGQNPLWDEEGTIEPFERANVKRVAANNQPSPESETGDSMNSA